MTSRPRIHRTGEHHDDRGAVLPLVLVMAVVISLVIAAVTSYVTTSLSYGNVVEERADRLAAADGGLRYAIERLQNSAYAGCLTGLGDGGYTIDFPVEVNGAEVEITCTKGSNSINDIKAWAIIVTGEGVPAGQPIWSSQAGGGTTKLLGGPVWITDPSRANLQAPVEVEDGDIWYSRADCTSPSLTLPANLAFTPDYRGTICVPETWDNVYDAPVVASWPSATNQAPVMNGACTVYSPGVYTIAPTFGPNTYFESGNYYFANVVLDVSNSVATAGWANFDKFGDQQFIANEPCDAARDADKAADLLADPGNQYLGGATFYFGGTTRMEIGNKGRFEIMRRLQGDSLVSIQVIEDPAKGAVSTLGYSDNIIWTKSGNNSDLALHGLLWAPEAQLEFGNVTNAANGQILGGAAIARIVLQASASASSFIIRVESSPVEFELRLDATATKNGKSTTMTAVVQVDDQGTTAVNSLRVRD
jgi:hypothetical protein